MKKFKEKIIHPAFIIALFFAGLLLLGLPLYPPAEVSDFFLFLGRLHPLVLHFPIVLMILTLLFEVARHYKMLHAPDNVVFVILLIAAASTAISAGAGFFLFASGDYAGQLVDQHFWAGALTGFAIFTTAGIFLIYRKTRRYYFLYVIVLIISNMFVAYTSHLGGSITHGKGYLTEHLRLVFHKGETHAPKAESEMLVYEDMLAPIFEAKCMSCHNAQRAKGNFLMTSYDNLFKSGESNLPSVTAASLEKSEVYKRITLPEDDPDHMPPEGKTPMTEDEIKLLAHWIKKGAAATARVQEFKQDTGINRVIEDLLPQLTRYKRRARLTEMKAVALDHELKEIATALSVRIQNDSTSDDGYFSIAMNFPPAPFTNEQFKILHPYVEFFSTASLVSSGIDDAGLYYIGQMTNLEKLFLQKTSIYGSGLVYLQNLPKLKVLNLSFTKVDDKAALDLLKFPSLEEVYLYRTLTTKEVVDALQKNNPRLKIYLQEGPYF